MLQRLQVILKYVTICKNQQEDYFLFLLDKIYYLSFFFRYLSVFYTL